MSGNSFAGIDAGTSTPPFTLSAGKYVVAAHPGQTGPGQWGGQCSLQIQQVQILRTSVPTFKSRARPLSI